MHLSDVYMFFFSRGVKVFSEIHRSRHTARLFGLQSLCGFSLLLVLITPNPSDRSGVDKSHLNWDCSKGAIVFLHRSPKQSAGSRTTLCAIKAPVKLDGS